MCAFSKSFGAPARALPAPIKNHELESISHENRILQRCRTARQALTASVRHLVVETLHLPSENPGKKQTLLKCVLAMKVLAATYSLISCK